MTRFASGMMPTEHAWHYNDFYIRLFFPVFGNLMSRVPSRCGACGRFFESRKALRQHIDKEHRITNEKFRSV